MKAYEMAHGVWRRVWRFLTVGSVQPDQFVGVGVRHSAARKSIADGLRRSRIDNKSAVIKHATVYGYRHRATVDSAVALRELKLWEESNRRGFKLVVGNHAR